ncbi:MAG TPA: hypothetical protein VGM91_04295 [Conexibacter sp.]
MTFAVAGAVIVVAGKDADPSKTGVFRVVEDAARRREDKPDAANVA